MNLKNKKVLVVGLEKSGKSAIILLLKQQAIVYVYDDNKEKLLNFLQAESRVKTLTYQTEKQIKEFNYIIMSPGIKPNHNIVSIAKYCEVPVINEMELYYLLKKPFLIGITGSNGKTTTTLLTEALLNSKYKVKSCGNIGKPLCDMRYQQCNSFVVETSSFQLEYINKLRYNISAILNISENHLDWHFNFKDYIKAKANIYKNSQKRDVLILNKDDKNIQKLDLYKTKCKVLWFSIKKECCGIYIYNNKIILNLSKKEEICDVSAINLLGEHNLQNVLVAVLIAKLNNVSNKQIVKVLNEFKSPEHRLELFYSYNNIDCFNDSKSTTVDSTVCAIKALKNYNIILLLGGSNKNLNYDTLAKKVPKNVRQIFVFGETKKEISASLNKFNINHIVCKNINEAIFNSVSSSLALANVNNTTSHNKTFLTKTAVLFSPACASFDSFNSYEERGVYFKEYLKSCVEDLIG